MSTRFDALTDAYSATTGLPDPAGFTMTFWAYMVTDRATDSTIIQGRQTVGAASGTGLYVGPNPTRGLIIGDDVTTSSAVLTMAVGRWYKIAVRCAGSAATLSAAPTGSAMTNLNITLVKLPTSYIDYLIGANEFGAWFNGRIQGFRSWNAVLTDAEVDAEFAASAPVRTSGLMHDNRMLTGATLTDSSGNGYTLTAGSTATTTEQDVTTRFYLPSAGSAAVSPAFSGSWNTTTGASRLPCDVVKSNSTVATDGALTKVSQAGAQNILNRQFVSGPLKAATVAGTYNAAIRGAESTTAADAWLQLIIRAVSNDGATVRGTLHAGDTNTATSATAGAANQELATAQTSRIKSALALTSTAISDGDRLVIEVGIRAITANTNTATLTYGDASATADHALLSTETAALNPWVELTGIYEPYAAPTGPEPGRFTMAWF